MKKYSNIFMTIVTIIAVFMVEIAPAQTLQYWRPASQRGVNVFETPKTDTVKFDGLKVRIGGNLALQYQMLRASNNPAVENAADSIVTIGNGFNLATANFNIDAQLDDGIRLNLTTYLSSRHHNDAWVKGGYLQMDKMLFLHSDLINSIMKRATVKVGYMDVNFGDSHFRRTDNGNAMYNPFVGNLIMDPFTTELAGEVYYYPGNFITMVGISNGELNDNITKVGTRKPAFYGKLGYDQQISPATRVRLTGSAYFTNASAANHLYSGDRAGSRYYLVLTNSTDIAATRTSGMWDPGFSYRVAAFALNPFIKVRGLELFGDFETAKGRSAKETEERTVNQMSVDAVYRFFPSENFFIGARYDKLTGALEQGITGESINRVQIGGGWYMTKNVLVKAEYVNQKYNGFGDLSIYRQGEFHGGMIEAVIGF